MLKFAQWFNEWADFGFEQKKSLAKSKEDDGPMKSLDLEYVTESLSKHNLGIKSSKSQFSTEVIWGHGPGAIKLDFSPPGGIRAIIYKNIKNLQGESTWICKRVLEVNDKYFGKPDNLIADILKLLAEVDKEKIEAPKKEFKDLEHLVTDMAGELKRSTTQKVLIFEGIRRLIDEKHYIIHMGCTGMGVQRQDQKRLDQFQIDVRFLPEDGLIRVVGQEIGGPKNFHAWQTDPSEFIEWYSPVQPDKEIISSIVSMINCY